MCENSPEEVLQSNSQGIVDYEPKVGLEFDSDKDALNYYNEYARRVGFSVRKEYINTNKKLGYVTSRKITCFKESFRRDDKQKDQVKKLRRETRPGCQAHITKRNANNTQLSESLNGDLKDYLQSDYNLVQFFKHYDRAIKDKRYNELQDTCDASQRIPVLKAQVPILIHAREVYTSNIFAKFQDEYMKSLSIKVNIGCGKNTLSTIYNVSKHGHTREYIVTVTEVGHISCTCLKFESMGIYTLLPCNKSPRCSEKGVSRIPTEYILDRWTKNAKGVNIKEVDEQEIEIKDPKLITMNRYRVLCPIFVRMVAKASETDDGYKVAVACANELSSKLKQIAEVTIPSFCTSGSTRELLEENNNINILTRAKSFKKKDGKRHKKRIKPSLEVNANRKKARGNKSSSAKQDGPRVDDRALSDNDKYFNQDPISTGNIYENSDLSASQTMACASLSHSSEFSLSLPYPNFTQMLTEPFSLDTFVHAQKSYSFFHDQANLFESQGSQKLQDNNTL